MNFKITSIWCGAAILVSCNDYELFSISCSGYRAYMGVGGLKCELCSSDLLNITGVDLV